MWDAKKKIRIYKKFITANSETTLFENTVLILVITKIIFKYSILITDTRKRVL